MKGAFLIVASVLCMRTLGLPNGAPEDSCIDLTPRHPGVSNQESYPPPYQVLPAAGQGRVRLILGSPQGLAYQGFMILARDADTGELVGEFANLPDTAKIVECTRGVKNAVTHTNTSKKHNLELDWEAPVDYEGTIVFKSTFAQDYNTYWVGVESPRVNVRKRFIDVLTSSTPGTTQRATTPPYYSPTVDYETKDAEDPFYTGCGSTKNCFGTPPGCVETKNCMAAVAVLVRGERYLFELQARDNSKYVAVGLSDDSKMGDDSVVECTNENGEIGLHMSWNTGKKNTRQPMQEGAVKLEAGSIKDDMISCKFLREKTTVVQGREYDLVNKPYNLLIAAGKGLNSNGVGFHDAAYAATGGAKLLSDVGGFTTASNVLIRVHGALMLASWIGTASVGILLARYYRQTWVSSQLCGKDHWFAWHRFFMILTWSMTIAAFVIIFVELGEWSSEVIHASLGLATTILAFVQPFMAVMRPHPGAPRRPLFNWAHWFVGNAAQICGIIAIFFAVRLNKAKLPEWMDWILVAYVVFHILTHLVLTFVGCASDRQASQRVNSFPMKDMHSRGSMVHPDARQDAPHAGVRKFIFGVYFVVIVLFTAALIVITVLAPIEDTWVTITNTIKNY
ncbi:putative ferric-chelate reductase 1 homolog [Ceratina calcarata]|uniref:Ferric-chelate reductase 1 homolog n=1 Tax=Ceratina calcarata TaxID=156304 RepID=A0AAJ7N3Q8_9HYME|nr:putative ferric-chelate reductase 1 homolog [Ceratina calcarata]XP_017875393.1 putative ferric-chelate reductase 1 homolog [Ceratina calcarata]